MRKVIVLVLALALGGCVTVSDAINTVSLVTKSHSNPVTKNDLFAAESAVTIVFVGLNTYKRSCVQGLVDTHCKGNIATIQVYTRQLSPLLSQLRGFVKNNDQINAIVVYNQITQLITNVKSLASATGIKIGG